MATFRTLRHPTTMYWEITDSCNHNCVHCFNYWRSDTQRSMPCAAPLRNEQVELLLEKIIAAKPVKVVLTGGEPLAVWPRARHLAQKLLERGIGVSFNTNAALITDEMADFFRDNRISLFISFPSAVEAEFDEITDTPGAYWRVISALELLHRKGVRFATNMVVSRVNLKSIFATAQFLNERFDLTQISVTRVSEPVNARDRFGAYLLSAQELQSYTAQCVRISRELGMRVRAASPLTPCSLHDEDARALFGLQNSCEAGRSSCVVGATGAMRACVRDTTEYGNLLDEALSTIWARMQPWREDTHIPAECGECTHKLSCRGGCRVDRLSQYNVHHMLDRYSDPRRTYPEFCKTAEPLPQWGVHQAFSPVPTLKGDDEGFCVRVSSRYNATFCTPDFAEYLLHTPRFTVGEFCRRFDVDVDRGVEIIYQLYKSQLLLAEE